MSFICVASFFGGIQTDLDYSCSKFPSPGHRYPHSLDLSRAAARMVVSLCCTTHTHMPPCACVTLRRGSRHPWPPLLDCIMSSLLVVHILYLLLHFCLRWQLITLISLVSVLPLDSLQATGINHCSISR